MIKMTRNSIMAATNLCVTVSYGKVSGKAKKYQYWQPALYQIHYRKDGIAVWKYIKHLGRARRSERLATQDAIDFHKELGAIYLEGIRQYRKVFGNDSSN